MGSTQFVQEYLPECGFKVKVIYVLEMVGYCSQDSGSQRLPKGLPITVPDAGNFLAILANRHSNRLIRPLLRRANAYCENLHVIGLQIFFGMEMNFPHLLRSDHAPFWRAGLPALMWTDTSEFRNSNYHKPSDTPETLDYGFMKKVTQALLASLAPS